MTRNQFIQLIFLGLFIVLGYFALTLRPLPDVFTLVIQLVEAWLITQFIAVLLAIGAKLADKE